MSCSPRDGRAGARANRGAPSGRAAGAGLANTPGTMRTHRAHSSLWLLAATGLLAAGCQADSPPVQSHAAPLHRAESCDDLAASLKRDALAKMNAQIDAMIASYSAYGTP